MIIGGLIEGLDWGDVVKILIMLHGFFTIGMSAVILRYYIFDVRIRHIAVIILSYILLTYLAASAIVYEMYPITSFRVFIAATAFITGDYAIIAIFKHRKNVTIARLNNESR